MLPIEQHAKEMKTLAEQLVPYSYPIRSSADENDIYCLKQREVVVDGYHLLLWFSRQASNDVYADILQVTGLYFSFLPFDLLCKLAGIFLGNKNIYFSSVTRNVNGINKKIYIWTAYIKDGKIIINNNIKSEKSRYFGIEFLNILP